MIRCFNVQCILTIFNQQFHILSSRIHNVTLNSETRSGQQRSSDTWSPRLERNRHPEHSWTAFHAEPFVRSIYRPTAELSRRSVPLARGPRNAPRNYRLLWSPDSRPYASLCKKSMASPAARGDRPLPTLPLRSPAAVHCRG